jgi:hypothetical protein
MKKFQDPVRAYHRDMVKIIGRMGREIDRCNKLHLKLISSAVNKFDADLTRIMAKYDPRKNSSAGPAAKAFQQVRPAVRNNKVKFVFGNLT